MFVVTINRGALNRVIPRTYVVTQRCGQAHLAPNCTLPRNVQYKQCGGYGHLQKVCKKQNQAQMLEEVCHVEEQEHSGHRAKFIVFLQIENRNVVFDDFPKLEIIFSSDCNFDYTIRILSSFLPCAMAIVRFAYSNIYRTTVQTLFMEVKIDWKFFVITLDCQDFIALRTTARRCCISTQARSVMFDSSHAMAEGMTYYYKWSIFLLTLIGFSPNEDKKFRLLRNCIICFIFWWAQFSQIIALISGEITLHRVLKSTSFIAVTMDGCVQYCGFWYHADLMKHFLDQVKQDWATNDEDALRIIRKYTNSGKHYTTIFISCIFLSICMAILYHVWPIILNRVKPLDESRLARFPVEMDFLINEDKHPAFVIFMQYSFLLVCFLTFIGTESFLILFGLHIAGLFEVTSYYFRKAIFEDSTQTNLPQKCMSNKSMNYLVNGIIIHRKTLELTNNLNTHSSVVYPGIMVCGVISLSSSLFFLSPSVFNSVNIDVMMLSLMIVISITGYAFFLNLVVQYIRDSADNIPVLTYDTNWYEASATAQKLLWMIILISNRGVSFRISGIYSPSFEGFSAILRISLSYVTVMLSLQ